MTRISNPGDVPQAASGGAANNGKTVLLAEDDPFISRMYETKLKSAGFQVAVETNGRDAYAKIKSLAPDLIMLDINMPELTGFEVLGALVQDGYDFSKSPVVVLTNSANPADRAKAEQMGVDYMIKAELTPKMVLETINQKLGLA